MSDDDTGIGVRLSKAEALVLFELLSRVESEEVSITPDTAEWRALDALCCHLEKTLVEPFLGNYPRMVADAKKELLEKYGNTSE